MPLIVATATTLGPYLKGGPVIQYQQYHMFLAFNGIMPGTNQSCYCYILQKAKGEELFFPGDGTYEVPIEVRLEKFREKGRYTKHII